MYYGRRALSHDFVVSKSNSINQLIQI